MAYPNYIFGKNTKLHIADNLSLNLISNDHIRAESSKKHDER